MIHVQARNGHLACLEYLLESCGCDLNALAKHGVTPLQLGECECEGQCEGQCRYRCLLSLLLIVLLDLPPDLSCPHVWLCCDTDSLALIHTHALSYSHSLSLTLSLSLARTHTHTVVYSGVAEPTISGRIPVYLSSRAGQPSTSQCLRVLTGALAGHSHTRSGWQGRRALAAHGRVGEL